MLPKACAKTGAVLLVGFHEAPSTATVLKEEMLYLSLESSIESSNNDSFPSISHLLTEIHNVWELQEAQKQQVQEEGAALHSRSSSTCPDSSTGHKENESHAAYEKMRAPETESLCPRPVGTKEREGFD